MPRFAKGRRRSPQMRILFFFFFFLSLSGPGRLGAVQSLPPPPSHPPDLSVGRYGGFHGGPPLSEAREAGRESGAGVSDSNVDG